MQQPGNRIDIRAGDMTPSIARSEGRGGAEGSGALRSAGEDRRGVDQKPALTVALMASDAGFGHDARVAVRAGDKLPHLNSTEEAAAGGRPQTTASSRPSSTIRGLVSRRLQMQVGAGVRVDFHADGDLDDTRRFPSMGISPVVGP